MISYMYVTYLCTYSMYISMYLYMFLVVFLSSIIYYDSPHLLVEILQVMIIAFK